MAKEIIGGTRFRGSTTMPAIPDSDPSEKLEEMKKNPAVRWLLEKSGWDLDE